MASPTPPRTFNLYEVIGVSIPGITLLLGVLALLPNPSSPTRPWQYVAYAIAALSLGYLVQYLAASAVGDPKTFERTMDEVRTPEDFDDSADEDAGSGDGNDVGAEGTAGSAGADESHWNADILVRLLYPFAGPLICFWRTPTDDSIDATIHANRVWQDLRDTYNLPRDFDNYEELQQLIQSEVDDVAAPSRAYRFQAIRNFHRGMWMAMWIVVWTTLLHSTIRIGNHFSILQSSLNPPALLSTEVGSWGLPMMLLSLPVFWLLYADFRRKFVTYLVLDYYVQSQTRNGGDPSTD